MHKPYLATYTNSYIPSGAHHDVAVRTELVVSQHRGMNLTTKRRRLGEFCWKEE